MIKPVSIEELQTIYGENYAQAGDTEEDFYKWAINYLIEKYKIQIKIIPELKRHLKGIEKAITKLEE